MIISQNCYLELGGFGRKRGPDRCHCDATTKKQFRRQSGQKAGMARKFPMAEGEAEDEEHLFGVVTSHTPSRNMTPGSVDSGSTSSTRGRMRRDDPEVDFDEVNPSLWSESPRYNRRTDTSECC